RPTCQGSQSFPHGCKSFWRHRLSRLPPEQTRTLVQNGKAVKPLFSFLPRQRLRQKEFALISAEAFEVHPVISRGEPHQIPAYTWVSRSEERRVGKECGSRVWKCV